MSLLADLLRHPATLAVSLLLGAGWGAFAPEGAAWLSALGGAYISLLNMAATPLVVVAVFFGLRRVLALPNATPRLLALVGGGVAAMLACALVAALLAGASGAGRGLSERDAAVLGELTLHAEGLTSIHLYGTEAGETRTAGPWKWPVSGNFYHALAYEPLPAVLLGALLFGFALAAQPNEQSRHLFGQLEAVYRTLEKVIERLNTFLPLVAFALAAIVVASTGTDWLGLMRGFLVPYFVAVALLSLACAFFAGRHRGVGPMQVMQGLRRPLTVSLFSGGPAAALPGFIDALCNQLGFRRDLVEFAAPLAPTFLRVGEAVFFAVLAVFVSQLYGRELAPLDLAVIGAVATLAGFASITVVGGRSLAAGGAVLAWLGLPMEALLPAFVLLELVCEGPRNFLSLMLAAALVALVSRGLPSEVRAPAPVAAGEHRWRLVLRPRQAAVASALAAVALVTVLLAGMGVGLRQGAARPGAPVSAPSGVSR